MQADESHRLLNQTYAGDGEHHQAVLVGPRYMMQAVIVGEKMKSSRKDLSKSRIFIANKAKALLQMFNANLRNDLVQLHWITWTV